MPETTILEARMRFLSPQEMEEEDERFWRTMPCSDCVHLVESNYMIPYRYCGIGIFMPVAKKSCKRQQKVSNNA